MKDFHKEILCFYLSYRIRSLGSAALNMCMVALGGADVSFEFGIHAWDIAAGDLIVREAGGVSIDPAGINSCKILVLIESQSIRVYSIRWTKITQN